MKKTKIIALFLIMLVLTLPIYSSLAYGDFEIISVSGKDGAKKETDSSSGYRAQDDTTTIIINSSLSDVRCTCNANSPLDCTSNNGSYQCVFEDEGYINDESKIEYTFYQMSGNNPVQGTKTATAYIDSAAPRFSRFNLALNDGVLVASYNITDYGSASSTEGCSGIRTINFYDNGYNVGTINEPVLPGTCSYSGIFTYPTPSPDGEHEFQAEAVDYVSNTNTSSKLVMSVDLTSPSLSQSFLLRNGVKLEYISTAEIQNVQVSLIILDSNISVNGAVSADLSKLHMNPSISVGYKNVPFTCSLTSELSYQCSSAPISILLSSSSAPITVYMKDVYGNNATQTSTITLNMDDAVQSATLKTENCNDALGQCYVHPGINVFIAEIENQGAGFTSRQIYFRSETLEGDTAFQANVCEQSGNDWVCKKKTSSMPLTLATGSSHDVSLVWPSQDDVGNLVTPKSIDVIFDKDSPELLVDSSLSQNPLFQRAGGFPVITSNDQIEIKVWVKDGVSGVKKISADLHEIIPGVTWVESEICIADQSRGDNVSVCTITPGAVYPGPLKDKVIRFNVTDYAGNVNTAITGKMTVFSLSNNNMTFWKAPSNIDAPFSLDRTTSQYVPGKLPIWVNVPVVSASGARLLHAELAGGNCVGVNNSYLENSRLYPITPSLVETSSASIPLVLHIRNSAPLPEDVDLLRFKCKFVLTSAKGDFVYPTETHEVEIDVKLEDYGLDLPADYQDRIHSLIKDLKDDEWIDNLNNVFQTALKLCQVIKTLTKILEIYQMITGRCWSYFEKMSVTYAVAQGCKVSKSAIAEVSTNSIATAGSWACSFVDCSLMDRLVSKGVMQPGAYTKFLHWYMLSLTVNSPDQLAYQDAVNGALDGGSTWEASKKSIIVSALAVCIPGIIYNIEKARQIDCMYVDCAMRWTAAGLNPYTCEAMRANTYCNFVYGSIFHALPYSGVIDMVGNFVKLFSSNPWAAVGIVWGLACSLIPSADASELCSYPKRIFNFINFLSGTINMYDTFRGSEKDYCEIVFNTVQTTE